ncbi:hypothetical protein BD769DRAFT_1683036 [Suillus cothurnatus]|nr:hypothetical protein BD769DRAFT_1683036 [Suillus cothurnatus]
MLVPAVLDFIHIFDAVGSFIFVDRAEQGNPTFHIQTCHEILSANSHFPTKPDASVLYAGTLLRQKPAMLRGKTSSTLSSKSSFVPQKWSPPLPMMFQRRLYMPSLTTSPIIFGSHLSSSLLYTMCLALMELLNVFEYHTAFILISRASPGPAEFHVLPSEHIRASPSQSSSHEPVLSVLFVGRHVLRDRGLFASTVRAIAFDAEVHTVCTASAELAELLASHAALLLSSHERELVPPGAI